MEEIIQYVATYAPIVVAVIIEILVFVLSNKNLKGIVSLTHTSIKTMEEKSEQKELKIQLKLAIEENKKLREELNSLICAVNHIYKPEGKHVCDICNKEI